MTALSTSLDAPATPPSTGRHSTAAPPPPTVTQADAPNAVDGEAPRARDARPAVETSHIPRQLASPTPPQLRRWRPKLRPSDLVVGAALAGLTVFACWWAWVDAFGLVDIYGHNLHVVLAPVAIACLWWRRRARVRHIRIAGRWLGAVLAAVGLGSLTVGGQAGVSMLYHLGALLMALGALVSVCGRGLILRMMPVLFAGLFLLPLPGRVRDLAAAPVRAATARLATGGLDLIGLGVAPDGRSLAAAAGPSRVAVACEALPLLMTLLVIVYTFAFSTTLRNRYRWLLLALVPLVALMLNVIRAAPLIWLSASRAASPDPATWDQSLRLTEMAGDFAMPVLGMTLIALLVRGLAWAGLRTHRYRLAG